MNATMEKFGYPHNVVADYAHWVVLLRPAQVTLASLVLAAKSDATAFGDLPPGAYAELGSVTHAIEATLAKTVQFERINYLMLMMVDPHVHFHVLPRYDGTREKHGLTLPDVGWPKTPDLASAAALAPDQAAIFCSWLRENWAS